MKDLKESIVADGGRVDGVLTLMDVVVGFVFPR